MLEGLLSLLQLLLVLEAIQVSQHPHDFGEPMHLSNQQSDCVNDATVSNAQRMAGHPFGKDNNVGYIKQHSCEQVHMLCIKYTTTCSVS